MAKEILNPIPVTVDFKPTADEFREFIEENGLSYAVVMRRLIKHFMEKNRGKKLDFDFSVHSIEEPGKASG